MYDSLTLELVRRITRAEERIERLSRMGRDRIDQVHWRTAVSQILALPALRAAWPMSSRDYAAPEATDVSGHGYDLTSNNGPVWGYDGLAPYVGFGGVNHWLSRADGGVGNWADILGTEIWLPAAQRGLTLGGWFQFDRLTNSEKPMSKVTAVGATSSYALEFRGDLAGDPAIMVIYDGLGGFTAVQLDFDAAIGTWYFLAGRFDPGNEIKVWAGSRANGLQSNTAATAIATLGDSAVDFAIGARGGGADFLDGKASMCWLSAAYLSDTTIGALFHHQRRMYGV